MHIPNWLKGGFLGVLTVWVVIFIKAICLDDWCFADTFLPIIFSPIAGLDYFLSAELIKFFGENIFLTISIFWFVIGSSAGAFFGKFRKEKVET